MYIIMLLLSLSNIYAELVLDEDAIMSGMTIDERDIYLGEFECISDTISGPRTLLRFPLVFNNIGDSVVTESKSSVVSYEVRSDANAVLQTGTIKIPCLRDSVCSGQITYYVCEYFSVSPGCSSIINQYQPCQWIDITNSTQDESYVVTLTFGSSIAIIPIAIDDTPAFNSGSTTQKVVAIVLLVIMNSMITCLPFWLYKIDHTLIDKHISRKFD